MLADDDRLLLLNDVLALRRCVHDRLLGDDCVVPELFDHVRLVRGLLMLMLLMLLITAWVRVGSELSLWRPPVRGRRLRGWPPKQRWMAPAAAIRRFLHPITITNRRPWFALGRPMRVHFG